MGSRNQNLCLQEVKKSFDTCFTFWHTFRLFLSFRFAILHVQVSVPVWSSLVHFWGPYPARDDFSPLPCLVLCVWPTLSFAVISHSLCSKACESYDFALAQRGPCFQRAKRTEGTDKEERGRHLFIVQSVTVANSLDLRRRDWLLNRMIYTAALVSVSWIWRSQLRLWVNVQLAPCGCLKWY